MQISHIFENTVIEKESDLAAQFLVVPDRSFSNPSLLEADQLLKVLHIKNVKKLRPTEMVSYFSLMLAKDDPEIIKDQPQVLKEKLYGSKYFDFAEQLIFGKHVPFEHSPIELESLGNLVAKASGIGVGAYVGFVISGTSPLLLLTVPAGMVICGAAAGVSRALEDGLKEKLLKLLKKEKSSMKHKEKPVRKIRIKPERT